jgi:prevent-host-death family protein
MAFPKPKNQRMQTPEVTEQLPDLLDAVVLGETRVIIERDGDPVAAIVSAEDLRRWLRFDRHREEEFRIIDELREAFKDVPPEEIEREADRAVAEIRGKVPAPA